MATTNTWPQFLWWWEIGGLSISIICCGLLILFLAKIDQMSVELWSLWMQPNTAIAILATFTKASMMVPVASCISQLKWWLFRKEQRPLAHLDLVDDASRGPWGAFALLFKLPRSSTTISLLALITIINLGIEPSAQQVLETSTRLLELADASAVVGVATAYESKGLRRPEGLEPFSSDVFRLYTSLLSGVDKPLAPSFECPGESCSWPAFSTLAVCSHFKNVTNEVESSCTTPWKYTEDSNVHSTDCNFTFPSNPYTALSTRFSNGSIEYIMVKGQYLDMIARPGTGFGSGITTVVQIIVGDHGFKQGFYELPPKTEAFEVTLYLCAQRITGLTAIPRQLGSGTVESEVAQRVPKGDDTRNAYYRTASSDELFTLPFDLASQLFSKFLPDALNGTSASMFYGNDFSSSTVLGDYLYRKDLELSFSNLATTLSSLMRSDAQGDNANATVVYGDAFIYDSFFLVRWAWLTVILVEVTLTAALLWVTIARSSRDPVLKTSNVALLVYGLNGWTRVEAPFRDTQEDLRQRVDGVFVRLEYTEDVGWGFGAGKQEQGLHFFPAPN